MLFNLPECYRFDFQVLRTATDADGWAPVYVISNRAVAFLRGVLRRRDPFAYSTLVGFSPYVPIVPGYAADVIRPTARFFRAGEGPTSVIPEFELPAGS